jgi:SAM-dependent methyltransferase
MDASHNASQRCPACGEHAPYTVRFRKQGFTISQCPQCKIGKTEISEDFDPHAYYTEDYFNGTYSDGYLDYRNSETVLRNEFRNTLQKIMNKTGIRSGRLFELGCAYGFFLSEAEPYFEVHGIEIAGDAVAACHSRGLLSVRQGVADDTVLTELGTFNLIVMLDVIEHLGRPDEVLQLLANHLAPGGALVLTTGDFGSLFSRLMGSRWRLLTPPQHLWFFTPASIKALAKNIGMEVKFLSHPSKIVPFSLIVFQIFRMLGLKQPKHLQGLSRLGVPVNLFDAMQVILTKPGHDS